MPTDWLELEVLFQRARDYLDIKRKNPFTVEGVWLERKDAVSSMPSMMLKRLDTFALTCVP